MAKDNNDGRPDWNADRALALLGRYVLVGITRVQADGKTFISQEQLHGVIVSADARGGIAISCRGTRSGETFTLPPHLDSFKPAPPGEFRLHSTGETVSHPDFITSWTFQAPPN